MPNTTKRAKTEIKLPEGVRHIHFIGIGGSGMFPIVQILHSQGYQISGSDNNESDIVATERSMGIVVTLGQNAQNLAGADMVVYTAAIMDTNPELMEAQRLGLPLWERAQMLGAISSRYSNAVGVSGTHGKTTVTSMLTQILLEAGRDPSVVIGGKLKVINGYGRAGKTDLFVYEACEFRDHFLQTYPDTAILLNIDNDHMEYFGTLDNAMRSYTQFASSASRVLYNRDDYNTAVAVEPVSCQKYSFGWEEKADFYPAELVQQDGFTRTFTLMHHGEALTKITLHLPGRHNILNAVAAAAGAWLEGVSGEQIAASLAAFCGAGRRFELVGRKNGITIVDDYAHHPAELEATLRAAGELGFHKVWAVFQPFTFSRTYLLLDDFVSALSLADRVVLSPIMGSREVNTYGVRSADIQQKLENCVCLETFEEIAAYVMKNASEGDLVITLGCGDIYKCARMMLQ
ncbi:MAG: UDP-N-acetylmuramate--L-alanine ligase [Angelakisella sp.]